MRGRTDPSTRARLQAAERRGRQMQAELAVALRALFVGASVLADTYRDRLRAAVRDLARLTDVPADESEGGPVTTTEREMLSQYYTLCSLADDFGPGSGKLLRAIYLAVVQREELTLPVDDDRDIPF